MEPTVVLVTLILQIATSRCRNIDYLNNEFGIDRDFVLPNIAGQFAFPGPPHEDLYQNLERFNELKKFLKVIPYKGNGDLKNKTIPGKHEGDKDFPIAVIMASNLDENLSDNLNPEDINDYFTKVIENSYNHDKTIDDKRKKGKKHPEPALENDNEWLVQHAIKLDVTTNKPAVDLNDKITDQESTEAINEMEIKKFLNEVKKKPNTNSNTQAPTYTNDTSIQQIPMHIEDMSVQHLLPTTEKNVNLNKIDADDDLTLQEDDILNVHDLIKSIHDLDKLQIEKYVEVNNDAVNKTIDVKSPQRQKIISCKEFNITDDLIRRDYSLKFVFNL